MLCGGLDRPSQDQLTELLGMLALSGRLIIAAHHDLDTVPAIFDEVLLVNRRRIAFGPVDEVFTAANLAACFGTPKGAETSPAPSPRGRIDGVGQSTP